MKVYPLFKQFFDVSSASVALLLLSPILLITAILIKIDSKGPVIFKQQRLGRYGKPFWMYKFRSMTVGAENQGSGVYS